MSVPGGRGKFFLDTNIFVYTFDKTSKSKREPAEHLVNAAIVSRRGIVSYQVVQEFLNVATRKFVQPLNSLEAQLYLTRVLMPLCEVFPDAALYAHALSVGSEAGISFYDALIVSSAIAGGCQTLFTEDLQHGRRIRGLEIRNPFRD